MRRAAFALLVLAGALAWGTIADAGTPHEDLQAAADAYAKAMRTKDRSARLDGFSQAERLFAQLARKHEVQSAPLYVDWGNAALQARRLGPAVLAYRRALVLDPGSAQARRNLAETRRLLPQWVPRPRDTTLTGTFFFWRHSLSRSARLSLAASCFLGACILLAVWIRWRRGWARNLAVLPLLLWAALVCMPLLDPGSTPGEDGVVTVPEAVVRSADAPGAPARFAEPLPGGSEVEIRRVRGDWARVRLADGRDGWVARGSVTFVDPARN